MGNKLINLRLGMIPPPASIKNIFFLRLPSDEAKPARSRDKTKEYLVTTEEILIIVYHILVTA